MCFDSCENVLVPVTILMHVKGFSSLYRIRDIPGTIKWTIIVTAQIALDYRAEQFTCRVSKASPPLQDFRFICWISRLNNDSHPLVAHFGVLQRVQYIMMSLVLQFLHFGLGYYFKTSCRKFTPRRTQCANSTQNDSGMVKIFEEPIRRIFNAPVDRINFVLLRFWFGSS